MRKYLILFMITLLVAAGQEKTGKKPEKEEDMGQYALAGKLNVPTAGEVSENPYIYRYNHGLCREKGLIAGDGRLSSRYLYLQAAYRANLDAYLLKALDIKKLDEELKSSSLGFKCPKNEGRNLYERGSAMGLAYICLRNNLYIENLEKSQLDILERHLKTGKEAVADEILEMVKESYKEVIRVRNPGNWEGEEHFLYAAAQGRKPEIPDDALVLEISDSTEYDASGNLLEECRMGEKYRYLEQVKATKEKEYAGILGIPVYILLE